MLKEMAEFVLEKEVGNHISAISVSSISAASLQHSTQPHIKSHALIAYA